MAKGSICRSWASRKSTWLNRRHRRHEGGRLRLVGADNSAYVRQVVRAIEQTIEQTVQEGEDPRVMLVGSSFGGAAAAEIASRARSTSFVVDQVITVGAPAGQGRQVRDVRGDDQRRGESHATPGSR